MIGLTNATGAIRTSYSYEPFGKTVTTGDADTNPFAFTGRENDGVVTGMYFLRARYYSPTFQRFTSEDPIGFAGSGVNLYAYVGNGPTNFADRLGLEREDGVVASHTTSPSHCSCSRSRLPRTTAADFMWIS